MNELEQLIPVPVEIRVGGEVLQLTPIRLGEVPSLARILGPIVGKLGQTEPDWLDLLSQHGGSLLSAMSIAARKPRDWIDGLEIDEAIRLAAALLEVNADFFIHRVLPAIESAAASIPSDSSNA
jgi:hypothetical protein